MSFILILKSQKTPVLVSWWNISGLMWNILYLNKFSEIHKWLSWEGVMVYKTTFSNISVILWSSFLLVEETGVPGENHQPTASYWQYLSHNVVSSTLAGFELATLVVIGTDCIGSCKFNYHTITTIMAPQKCLNC